MNATAGAGPAAAGGTRNGYDQEKSPVCADTSHVDAGFNDVAVNEPVPVPDTGPAIGANMTAEELTCGDTSVDFDAESNVAATGDAAAVFADDAFATAAGSCTQRTRDAKSAPNIPASNEFGTRTANGAVDELPSVR